MFVQKRRGGRAPPRLGWEGGGGGGGGEAQAAGLPPLQALGRRRHTPPQRRPGRATRRTERAGRPERRQAWRTGLFGLPPPPGKLRGSGQRADAWLGAHGSTIRPTDALALTGARDLRERAEGAGPVRQRKPGRRAAAR